MTEEMRTIEAYHIGPVAMFFGKLLGGRAKETDENGETHLGKKYGEPDPTSDDATEARVRELQAGR